MARAHIGIERRTVLFALGGLAALSPLGLRALAQGGGLLGGLLDRASDHALDKLAQPGAFYNDPAVRIALPGLGKIGGGGGGGLLGEAEGLLGGITGLDGITHKLNDAAGSAARAAKPVFHTAIAQLSLRDVPGIMAHSDGGTRYLRQSAGGMLHTKVRPLIDAALTALGAYREVDRLAGNGGVLAQLGLSRDKLGNSVTEQALNGIFAYMGVEEGHLRANPLGALGGAASLLGNGPP
jgi:hypothetical protein